MFPSFLFADLFFITFTCTAALSLDTIPNASAGQTINVNWTRDEGDPSTFFLTLRKTNGSRSPSNQVNTNGASTGHVAITIPSDSEAGTYLFEGFSQSGTTSSETPPLAGSNSFQLDAALVNNAFSTTGTSTVTTTSPSVTRTVIQVSTSVTRTVITAGPSSDTSAVSPGSTQSRYGKPREEDLDEYQASDDEDSITSPPASSTTTTSSASQSFSLTLSLTLTRRPPPLPPPPPPHRSSPADPPDAVTTTGSTDVVSLPTSQVATTVSSKLKTPVIVGIVLGSIVIFLLLVLCSLVMIRNYNRRRRSASAFYRDMMIRQRPYTPSFTSNPLPTLDFDAPLQRQPALEPAITEKNPPDYVPMPASSQSPSPAVPAEPLELPSLPPIALTVPTIVTTPASPQSIFSLNNFPLPPTTVPVTNAGPSQLNVPAPRRASLGPRRRNRMDVSAEILSLKRKMLQLRQLGALDTQLFSEAKERVGLLEEEMRTDELEAAS